VSTGWLADLGAALKSPLVLFRLPRRAWRWLVIYLLAAGALLALVGALVGVCWTPAKTWLIAFVVPASWRPTATWLVDHLLAEQERALIANAIVTGSLMVVTVTLFLVKEHLSLVYEQDARLLDGAELRELPLWEQGWQELKLFAFYLAVQASLFWMGLGGHAWKRSALVLSYGFMFFAYSVDFVSPIFQRHQGRYSQILKAMLATPLASFLFGAMFAAPVVVAARLWAAHPGWSMPAAVTVLFAANLCGIAWAAVAGTWFGARIFPRFAAAPRSHWATRSLAWLAVVALLAANGYGYGRLAVSVRAKSQLLKCHYHLVLSSFRLDTSSLPSLLDDEARLTVTFDVEIENPTALDVAVEDSRLELRPSRRWRCRPAPAGPRTSTSTSRSRRRCCAVAASSCAAAS
jgi:hypothetical protein